MPEQLSQSRRPLCRFCRAPIPEGLPPQSKYCCRSHRQRAYEARQNRGSVTELRRELRYTQLQRDQLAELIERLTEHPGYGPEIATAYRALISTQLWPSATWR